MKRCENSKNRKNHKWAEAERRCWEDFCLKLEKVQSFAGALELVANAVPPDTPGRKYYSNLGFFLQNFTPPGNSSYIEKILYIQFIQRIDQAGELKPGAKSEVELALRRAMNIQNRL